MISTMRLSTRSRAKEVGQGAVKVATIDLFINLLLLFMFLMGDEPQRLALATEMSACETKSNAIRLVLTEKGMVFDGKLVKAVEIAGKTIGGEVALIELHPLPTVSLRQADETFRQLMDAGLGNIKLVLGCEGNG